MRTYLAPSGIHESRLGAAAAFAPRTRAVRQDAYSKNLTMTNRTIARRVRLTQTEYAVLATLGHFGDAEVSGYDVKKFVDDALGYVWGPSKTHLYTVLRRLVDSGLATRREVAQRSRPNKQLYRITDRGREVVREWLDRPETETDPDRSIFMLKFFFGGQAGREPLLEQLRAFRDLYGERLQTYERIRDSSPMSARPSEFTYRALLYGIARAEAAVTWADATLDDLERQ
jgi:DNA-binding PadR family transcriptional regulator